MVVSRLDDVPQPLYVFALSPQMVSRFLAVLMDCGCDAESWRLQHVFFLDD